MTKCHYCKEELETAEYLDQEDGFASGSVCMNETCQIHKVVNLYFKPWFLTSEVIAEKLDELEFSWAWCGKFYIYLTSQKHHEIRTALEKICSENGSILFDSEIDFVNPVPTNSLYKG